jgi:hypothetical protein
VPQQTGHQQPAAAPAQGHPKAIGAPIPGPQALGERIKQPLAEGEVLLAAALSPAEADLPRAGGPPGTAGEGQKGLEMVEKPRRRVGPGAPAPPPGAGGHPEQWALPIDDPTPGWPSPASLPTPVTPPSSSTPGFAPGLPLPIPSPSAGPDGPSPSPPRSATGEGGRGWPPEALELAQRLQRSLVIEDRHWHRLKAQRARRAAEQLSAALVQLLAADDPGSAAPTPARADAIALVDHALGWLRAEVSDPGCPTHGR